MADASEAAWRRRLKQIDEALAAVTLPDQRLRLMDIRAEAEAKLRQHLDRSEISGTG